MLYGKSPDWVVYSSLKDFITSSTFDPSLQLSGLKLLTTHSDTPTEIINNQHLFVSSLTIGKTICWFVLVGLRGLWVGFVGCDCCYSREPAILTSVSSETQTCGTGRICLNDRGVTSAPKPPLYFALRHQQWQLS